VAAALSKHLGREVNFAEDCVGESARAAVGRLQAGQVLLLENVRFHPEDEADDPDFARRLAAFGELFVNDAFAASHRAHASVVGVAAYLPAYAGELMEAELTALHKALDDPKRPLVAVVGGAKVSTKVGVLTHLLQKVDALLIGGAMANTFFRAQGHPTGSGLVEESALEDARKVDQQGGKKLVLPVDLVCARKMEAGQPVEVVAANAVEAGWMALDIGPKSVAEFGKRIAAASTVVWNGPMGVAEIPEFSEGTRAVGEAVAASAGFTLVGGGEFGGRVRQAHRRSVDHRLERAHGRRRDPGVQRGYPRGRGGGGRLRRVHAGRRRGHRRGHRLPGADGFLACFDRRRGHARVPRRKRAARRRDPQGRLTWPHRRRRCWPPTGR
jgi:phosphoglycerate kinase